MSSKLVDAFVDLRFIDLRQPRPQSKPGRDFDRNAEIFAHRQLGKNFGDLKGPGHAAPDPARRQQIGDVLTVEDDACLMSA